MTPKTNAAGVVIFLVWQQQFLMILRDDKPDIASPNMWCPVTGGREDDENFYQTAHRELTEEIGLVPKDLVLLGVSIKGNGFFFGRLSDFERDSIVLGEGQCFGFYEYEDLSKIEIAGAMSIYLDKYPQAFKTMAETEKPVYGRELGLLTWNGCD